MRNPLGIAADFFRSWIETQGSDRSAPLSDVASPSEEPRKASIDLGARIEKKMEDIHSSLTLRVHDLYAETWRLRDALDARLGALEKRIEENAARYETSILEIETAASQVKETCRDLAESLNSQHTAAVKAIESLRDAHERRLRHLEQNHRAEIAAVEHRHEIALNEFADAKRILADRVQSIVEEASTGLSSALKLGSNGLNGLTPLQRLAHQLQPWRRVRQLEDELQRFEKQIAELGEAVRVDGGSDREAIEEHITVSVDSGLPVNGNGNGHSNGNGHTDRELGFALGGLART